MNSLVLAAASDLLDRGLGVAALGQSEADSHVAVIVDGVEGVQKGASQRPVLLVRVAGNEGVAHFVVVLGVWRGPERWRERHLVVLEGEGHVRQLVGFAALDVVCLRFRVVVCAHCLV